METGTTDEIDYQKYDFKDFDHMDCLCKDAGELLKGIYAYGFERPSAIQSKAICAMHDGRDIVAQSQSGTGKTGAFTIGILTRIDVKVLHPQAIIVANTRDLAMQIHFVLTSLARFMNIKVALCIGGTIAKDSKTNLNDATTSHIWVGTPGRIVDLIERDKYNKNKTKLLENLKMLVLDEADVLLKDDFLEQIKKIVRGTPTTTQMCIFSATFRDDALEVTKHFMRNPVHILVEREKVSLDLIKNFKVDVGEERYKYDTLSDLYQSINICQAVIFVNTIEKADTLKHSLESDGHSVGMIHSKLTDIDRETTLADFRNMITRVIIATDIISRGIDVQQVGLVINYDIPDKSEQYIHRVGRSGRYNKIGVAINFVTQSRYDKEKIKRIEDDYKISIIDLPDLNDVNYYLTGSKGYTFIDPAKKE